MHFYSLRQLRNSLFNLFKQTNYNNIGILLKNNAVSVNLSKKIVSQPGIGSGSRKFIQLRKALLNWYITIEFMKMRKKYLQQGLIFLGKSNLKMSYICNHKQFLLILLQMGRNLKCLLIFSNFHHFHGRPEKKARDKRNYNFRPKDPTSDLAILWRTICPNNVAARSLDQFQCQNINLPSLSKFKGALLATKTISILTLFQTALFNKISIKAKLS